MSVEEKLVNRILSVGSAGIKKTDLRREFGDIDTQLENLISKGEIFVDKRANAYFCFHKSHYIQSLLNSDPRFKLTYEMIKSVDESVSSSSKDLVHSVETLANNISNLASVVLEMKNDRQSWLAQQIPARDVSITGIQMGTMTVQDFKEEFDVALANSGSSIGWIELANIRDRICDSCNISSDEFYRFVGELTSTHQDKYELSTGGREGVMVRGLLHGFVRCIWQLYPYKLDRNPYPSGPTPTLSDAMILGGKRHKEAKAALVSCISDLRSKISVATAIDKDFRVVTMIQDVGSGKTHLALHTKGVKEVSESAIVSYTDLSQISPRNMHSLYGAMLAGFTDEYVTILRKTVIDYLLQEAEQNVPSAKRIFNYGFFDFIRGKSLTDKADELLRNEIVPNYAALDDTLHKEFSSIEITILKLVIEGNFRNDAQNVATLEDIIASLTALARLNLKFLNKITLFQIDEFDSDKESIEFVKAVINAHLPATVLMLIFTPASYDEIRRTSVSVFDRLEKANYKIDIAGSNTLEEIIDIALEYIRHRDVSKSLTEEHERDLAAKVRVIYDEFADFRNVRSMLNIMYHATENAARRNLGTIDEQSIDETIKNVYPGLRIRGSLMYVPISDFIKIRRKCNDIQTLESGVRNAVKDLVNYAHEIGVVARPHVANGEGNGIDVIYSDLYGTKVAVAVVINKDHAKSFEQISNTLKSTGFVDRLVILTNANTTSGSKRGLLVNIDRCKMIDLIYFSNKYNNNEVQQDDSQRAILLAKSMNLC